jgi:UDP-3-O-[3-hydroxymyristoyl] N-acetylglucosamine deacetylase
MTRQQTVAKVVGAHGVGLHTGADIKLTIKPAPEGAGIVFVRTDTAVVTDLPARVSHVVDTRLATMLGKDSVTLSTVEHVMAALWAMGVDNARVEVTGPEVPVMDGSARAWVALLQEAGVVEQAASRKVARVVAPVDVLDGDKRAAVGPGSHGLHMRCAIDFKHPLITRQVFDGPVDGDRFCQDLAHARTFGFAREVEMLRKMGLARGGSLENAVVVDEVSILNPDGLRAPDEFVRHKVLDALGDLYLLGAPLLGRVELHKAGHALHVALVKALLASPHALEWVTLSELPPVMRPRHAGMAAAAA